MEVNVGECSIVASSDGNDFNECLDDLSCDYNDSIDLDGDNDFIDAPSGHENEVKDKQNVKKPEVGMVFDCPDECFNYYKNYGKQEGFGVVKRSQKRDEGVVRWITYACYKSRMTKSTKTSCNPTLSSRTNCPAKMTIALQPDWKFRLNRVDLEHNHTLSPKKARNFKCNKKLDLHIKRKLELNDQAGIRMNKNFNSLVVQAGGYENLPFSERDCRNYIDKARKSRFGKGDAEAILKYFNRMHEKDVGFFFRVQLDDEGRIRNIFWADARSRATYECFGDVVTFDTTYLTNKYDMPFAPFVGVNHHGQSVLLGCGLVSHEDTETFEWLFECWLLCMSRCPPKAIITDQCKAMQNAIAKVFPGTRHRWCLWHIMKKIQAKLGGYAKYEDIRKALHRCVYNTYTRDEFDEKWKEMIGQYKLSDNSWLIGLYVERQRWVPVYLKNTFFTGMSTTQRSESMNAFFDGYVNSKTSLKLFVEQYDSALRNKIEKENLADYHSFYKQFECATIYAFEEQFRKAYTNKKFREFQDELNAKTYCTTPVLKDEGAVCR